MKPLAHRHDPVLRTAIPSICFEFESRGSYGEEFASATRLARSYLINGLGKGTAFSRAAQRDKSRGL